MDAVVLAHVDLGDNRVGQGQRGGDDRDRRTEEREDRAVMVGIRVDVGEPYARGGRHGGGQARQA